MRLKEFLKDGGSIDSRWDSMSIPERISYIKQDLLKKGYTQNQTAAILGNLLQENTTLKTNTQNTKSGALGIAQWLGSRKAAIINQGKHSTITGQLDFLDKEIKGSAWTNNMGGKKAFFSIDEPAQLTRVFRKDFERPGEAEANDNKRIANAYRVLGLKVPSVNSNEQSPTYNSASEESTIQPLSIQDTRQFLVDDRGSFQATSPEFGEFIRLENEKTQQEQKAKEAELRNQKIQAEIEQKSAERNQLISMIPQAQYVGLQPQQFQKGGNTSDEKVYQTYERITGKPWVTAKEEGLTDGSYSKNIELQKALLESEKTNNKKSVNSSNKELSNTSNITDNINQKTDLKEQYGYDAATDSYGEYQIEEVILPKKFKLPIKNQQQAIADHFSAKNAHVENWKETPVVQDESVLSTIKTLMGMVGTDITNTTNGVSDFIKDSYDKGVNWYERNRDKNNDNLKEQESRISLPDYEPTMITGDTISDGSRRYHIPEIMDLSQIKFGTRNRGDLKELQSEGAPITAFNKFENAKDYFKNNKTDGENATYIGVSKNGDFKIGSRKDFEKTDYQISRTYSNKVVDFNMDGDKIKLVNANPKASKTNLSPSIKILDDNGKTKDGRLSILVPKLKDNTNSFGSVTGGRFIFQTPDGDSKLVSGSLNDLYKAFKQIKGNHKYLNIISLDNGSYSRGLRTKDKKMTEKDLRDYDNQNTEGGNFAYILPSNYSSNKQEFEEIYIPTKNIRTEEDASYKKGHSLINESKAIVLHHTGFTEDDLTKTLAELNKPGGNSAHIVIGKDGKRVRLANPTQVAFHAGKSKFKGRENVNDFSVGVEFQGDTNKSPLTDAQIRSFIEYAKPLIEAKKLKIEDITTHHRIAGERKPDITETEYQRILKELKRQKIIK